MKNFVLGILATAFVVLMLAAWLLGNVGTALNEVNNSAATITAPDDRVFVTVLAPTAVQQQGREVVVVEVTAVPLPTNTPPPVPTSTPAPTRPAIETLPLGEGPYTVEQMQVCRDVWAQSLQGELTPHQFSYCQAVVNRGQ